MGAGRPQGFTTALTDIDTAAQEFLGTIRFDYNATYKYVKFSGTTAVAVGDFMCYVVTDHTLGTVDGANSALPAGVAMAVHASGSVTYGWIQIRGVATLSTAPGGTLAAGSSLTNAGATAPALTVAAPTATAVAVGILVTATSPYVADLMCPN